MYYVHVIYIYIYKLRNMFRLQLKAIIRNCTDHLHTAQISIECYFFDLYNTQTLRLRFRSLEVLLLYASDPYVGIFRCLMMVFSWSWNMLCDVTAKCVCEWRPPFPTSLLSSNSRRCELSWTKVAETSASGDKMPVAVDAVFAAVCVIVWICYQFLMLCF